MKKAIFYLLLVFGALMFLYPFLWMITATLVPESDISSFSIIPSTITLNSYTQMFDKIPIGRALLNSILVASSVTAGVLIFGSMVGYALSRLEFKGRNLIFYIIIFTMTLPFQITLIPQYIIMVKLGWVDTYLALIVPYLMNALSIIMFRQYFKSIPQDLIDAARDTQILELAGHETVLRFINKVIPEAPHTDDAENCEHDENETPFNFHILLIPDICMKFNEINE